MVRCIFASMQDAQLGEDDGVARKALRVVNVQVHGGCSSNLRCGRRRDMDAPKHSTSLEVVCLAHKKGRGKHGGCGAWRARLEDYTATTVHAGLGESTLRGHTGPLDDHRGPLASMPNSSRSVSSHCAWAAPAHGKSTAFVSSSGCTADIFAGPTRSNTTAVASRARMRSC